MDVRKTPQRLQTLELLARLRVSHGFEIAFKANLKLGTVYGILMAFEQDGFVESRWEADEPQGRPRRRLYRLTASGLELLSEYRTHFGRPPSRRRGLWAISEDLHTAIDQVWGGIFAVGVKAERARHEAVRKP